MGALTSVSISAGARVSTTATTSSRAVEQAVRLDETVEPADIERPVDLESRATVADPATALELETVAFEPVIGEIDSVVVNHKTGQEREIDRLHPADLEPCACHLGESPRLVVLG